MSLFDLLASIKHVGMNQIVPQVLGKNTPRNIKNLITRLPKRQKVCSKGIFRTDFSITVSWLRNLLVHRNFTQSK